MSEIDTLIVRRAAEMAEKDGVAVQIVHVFGATSQLAAALAEARDRLINHPGQIADTLSNLFDADEAASAAVPEDLRRLVIAARIVAYEDQSPEALEELDKASEAFSELVPWDNEPDAEAERLAAEQAAAAAAEAERIAAEQEQSGNQDVETFAAAPEQEQEAAAPAGKPTRKAK